MLKARVRRSHPSHRTRRDRGQIKIRIVGKSRPQKPRDRAIGRVLEDRRDVAVLARCDRLGAMRGPFHGAPQRAGALGEFADPSGGRRGPALGRGEVGRMVVVDRHAGREAERLGRRDYARRVGEAEGPAAVASAELARRDQHDPLRWRAGGKIGVFDCGAMDRERAAPLDKLCGLEVRHVHRAEVCPNPRICIRVKFFTHEIQGAPF